MHLARLESLASNHANDDDDDDDDFDHVVPVYLVQMMTICTST